MGTEERGEIVAVKSRVGGHGMALGASRGARAAASVAVGGQSIESEVAAEVTHNPDSQ